MRYEEEQANLVSALNIDDDENEQENLLDIDLDQTQNQVNASDSEEPSVNDEPDVLSRHVLIDPLI